MIEYFENTVIKFQFLEGLQSFSKLFYENERRNRQFIIMITSLKPFNLLLFDTYILALLYLFLEWNKINCRTHSNIWQLFYYLILVARLLIDELQNNSKISKNLYWALTFLSSFVLLVGIGIYEIVTISQHHSDFDDPDMKSSCFQNRILLVGQCIFGFLIAMKDITVFFYERQNSKNEKNPLE